jgi:hypothetical protein
MTPAREGPAWRAGCARAVRPHQADVRLYLACQATRLSDRYGRSSWWGNCRATEADAALSFRPRSLLGECRPKWDQVVDGLQ